MTDEEAAIKAARIIDIAVAVHNRQHGQLKRMGLTFTQAARIVAKRYRGRVGEFIGDSLEALQPPPNKTAGAVRLVREHGASISLAAAACNVDRSNLVKAVRQAEREFPATKHPSPSPD